MLRYGDTKRRPDGTYEVPEVDMTFDVIVVGARVAGAATGMLLARAGLRVLVVDQAHFPSDTLSTHQIQVPGVARLARFGLLQPLLDAGTPPTPHVRFQRGGAVVEGEFPAYQGVNMMISPRRTILDALLVDAARAAGAEVREACSLVNLVKDRDRVGGVQLRDRGNGRVSTETALLVIGADGKHSKVARLAGAPERRTVPPATFAFYAYWDGLPVKGGEIYSSSGSAASAWPTNDGLTMTYVAGPIADFEAIRRDPTAHLIAALDKAGSLGERARAAVQVGRTRGTSDLPNLVRAAYGPGWALAGDAGLVMDPITGLGIGHALRDAELLSSAIVSGLAGSRHLNGSMKGYEKQRNHQTKAAFNWTLDVAGLRGVNEIEEGLFRTIGADEEEASQFFGMLTGVVPMRSFFSPAHLIRLIGVRDFLHLARARSRQEPSEPPG
jgi:2-polyprenyl-6-methoxyphenol hydroxylase-like FAD-dependent oxidoreductase